MLNVGCGQSFEGTDRIDFMKTPATTKIGDIEEGLPYEDNLFDKILCYRVLEHLRDLKSFMEECYRILKKGGEMHLQTDRRHDSFVRSLGTNFSVNLVSWNNVFNKRNKQTRSTSI